MDPGDAHLIFPTRQRTRTGPVPGDVRWDEKGVPHSLEFREHYFCTQNGYEEYRHISANGNDLPERFSNLDPDNPGTFRVIETGFGTGLCFSCIWQLWSETAPKSWALHYISVELYPLSGNDLDRSLSKWPELSAYRRTLVKAYQPAAGEVRDLYFENVRLTLVFQDVVDSLKLIREQGLAGNGTDVWLLNGFSPFSNPRMWCDEVFRAMAGLSKTGTTLSTFTVAGTVRRGLEDNGFTVKRVPGYGTKKQMLVGHFGPNDVTMRGILRKG